MKGPLPIPLCLVAIGAGALGFLLLGGSKKRVS